MHRSVLWRAAGLQLGTVAALSVALALALPHSFPAVVLGLHWLGVAIAVGLLAAWCARLSSRTRVPAWNWG